MESDRYTKYHTAVVRALKKAQYFDCLLNGITVELLSAPDQMPQFRGRPRPYVQRTRNVCNLQEINDNLDLVVYKGAYQLRSSEVAPLEFMAGVIEFFEWHTTIKAIFDLEKEIARELVFGQWYARFCADEWIASHAGLEWKCPDLKSDVILLHDVYQARLEYLEQRLQEKDNTRTHEWVEETVLKHSGDVHLTSHEVHGDYMLSTNQHPFANHPIFGRGRDMTVKEVSDLVDGLFPLFKEHKMNHLEKFATMKRDFLERFAPISITGIVSSGFSQATLPDRNRLQEAYTATGMTLYSGEWIHPVTATKLDELKSRLDQMLERKKTVNPTVDSFNRLLACAGSWTQAGTEYYEALMEFVRYAKEGHHHNNEILRPLVGPERHKIMTPRQTAVYLVEGMFGYLHSTLNMLQDKEAFDFQGALEVVEDDSFDIIDPMKQMGEDVLYGVVMDLCVPLSCDLLFAYL